MKPTTWFFIGLISFAFVSLSLRVNAGEKPPEDGKVKASACDTDAQSYDHGALKNFHGHLCHINVHFPALAEEFLYKLVVKLGMKPDLTALAADGTATNLTGGTHDGKVVTGTVAKVVAPSTFSTFYDYVAIVKVDGATHATMYWTGSGSASKGFLIMGGVGLGSSSKLLYVKWDRSGVAQTVDVLGSRFATSYLTTPSTDDAMYGSVTYNTSTKATTVQSVELGRQRGGSPSASLFACWRVYASGTSGGTMLVAKTNNALSSGTGHTDGFADQLGISEMDQWNGTDTKTEANGGGNSATASGFSLNYSCADLKGASAATKPFNGNVVNHSMTKTQMDAMFGVN